jgi:hypothetical protein
MFWRILEFVGRSSSTGEKGHDVQHSQDIRWHEKSLQFIFFQNNIIIWTFGSQTVE